MSEQILFGDDSVMRRCLAMATTQAITRTPLYWLKDALDHVLSDHADEYDFTVQGPYGCASNPSLCIVKAHTDEAVYEVIFPHKEILQHIGKPLRRIVKDKLDAENDAIRDATPVREMPQTSDHTATIEMPLGHDQRLNEMICGPGSLFHEVLCEFVPLPDGLKITGESDPSASYALRLRAETSERDATHLISKLDLLQAKFPASVLRRALEDVLGRVTDTCYCEHPYGPRDPEKPELCGYCDRPCRERKVHCEPLTKIGQKPQVDIEPRCVTVARECSERLERHDSFSATKHDILPAKAQELGQYQGSLEQLREWQRANPRTDDQG